MELYQIQFIGSFSNLTSKKQIKLYPSQKKDSKKLMLDFTSKRKKQISIIFIAYISFILFSVFFFLTSINELESYAILNIRADYFLHALMFLPWMAFSGIIKHKYFLWFCIGLLIAASAEYTHKFLNYRTFNIYDLIANTSGIILSLVIFLIFNLILSNLKHKKH